MAKLIIEIEEWAFHEDREIKATMSLPGLSKAGVLQVRSEIKPGDIYLHRDDYFHPGTIHYYTDTIQRYGRLENAIMNTIRKFYKDAGLTEAGSYLYYPKPAEP